MGKKGITKQKIKGTVTINLKSVDYFYSDSQFMAVILVVFSIHNGEIIFRKILYFFPGLFQAV